MANIQNLTQAGKKLSTEEAQKMGSKGGKASAKARREKKMMRDTLEALLSMPMKNGKCNDPEAIKNFASMKGKNIDVQTAITIAMIQKAMKGDVKAADWIRDTAGESPTNRIEVDADMELHIEIDYGDDKTNEND